MADNAQLDQEVAAISRQLDAQLPAVLAAMLPADPSHDYGAGSCSGAASWASLQADQRLAERPLKPASRTRPRRRAESGGGRCLVQRYFLTFAPRRSSSSRRRSLSDTICISGSPVGSNNSTLMAAL